MLWGDNVKELEQIIHLLEGITIDGHIGVEGYTADLLGKCKDSLLEIIQLNQKMVLT